MSGQTLTFIRRRPPHPAITSAAAPVRSSLSIAAPTDQVKTEAKPLAPLLDEVRRLDRENRMVRLSHYQSSIGSLQINVANSVGRVVLWELQDGKTGTLDDAPNDPARRPIVSVNKEGSGFVVGLRHVRALRRLVFAFSGDAGVSVQTISDEPLRTSPDLRVLEVYNLDGALFVRYDENVYDSPQALRAAYGL